MRRSSSFQLRMCSNISTESDAVDVAAGVVVVGVGGDDLDVRDPAPVALRARCARAAARELEIAGDARVRVVLGEPQR